jgi:6-phosphogluconolactonase
LAVLAQQVKTERPTNGAALDTQNGNGAAEERNVARTAELPSFPAHSAPDNPRIHVIAGSRWPNGIPAVMGAHLMMSGSVAPISTSKGPGEGEPHLFFYPEVAQENYIVEQFVNAELGSRGLAQLVSDKAAAAIKEKGSFTIVLSGGSLLKALAYLVKQPGQDFSKWHVAYADERNVPHTAEDSNHKGATDAFLAKAGIPENQIIALKEGLPVKQAATEYEGQLLRLPSSVLPRNSEGFPVFDLVLLGIGPDGHVASLFPNREQTAAKEGWVLPVSDSPKPPSERITLTLPVLNSAANVAIVAFGAGKAEIVQRALEVQSLPGALPAQLVRPSTGTLHWLLDCESASHLSLHKWQNTKDFPRSQ